ncbi:MAG: type I DNA topoisomerase [Bacteroidales bacterium]|jgi:DNA topoisomerase-1|nr:type I DNA topoisomerase [Bacteroidales bacterium]
MSKNLVIVESPAKAKTIGKFLGKDYVVKSSMGHVRDLPEKKLGVDIEHDFMPLYEVSTGKKKIIHELKTEANKADCIWLATDEDREGEAISWHLIHTLELEENKIKRIAFHEITKSAIENAIAHPRPLDNNLVDAQQARRVLDRLVGFELSPVLWKKVKPSLSAGRVQSVAVRLIVEKEKEIKAFQTSFYYRLTAEFTMESKKGKEVIKAELNTRFKTKSEAMAFLEECKKATFTVENVEKHPVTKSPAAPFTTSTLQQEASRKLGFPVIKTMLVAQQLYEAGFITYMRTDSVNLSDLALADAKKEILSAYGKDYSKTRKYTTKTKGAQEAHEAIRPTYISQHSIDVTDASQAKLYDLIWKRTIASQMSNAELEKTNITIGISNQQWKFIATGEVLLFDGFLKVYMESHDDEDNNETISGQLPAVAAGDKLLYENILAAQRYAQAPYRYTEASLVKKMEDLGIGRPSTYAPTISVIQKRGYIIKSDKEGTVYQCDIMKLENNKITETTKKEITGKEKGKLVPTDIGIITNDYLVDNFKDILDYDFTAKVEKQFDNIAEGKQQWQTMLKSFYGKFHKSIETALTLSKRASGERLLGIDPQTQKEVFVKIAKYGAVAQLGNTNNADEKVTFAKLPPRTSMETITLEEALELFKLPRKIPLQDGSEIVVNVGRYGPYIHFKEKYYSLSKDTDILAITVDECKAIIAAKDANDELKKPIVLGQYNDKEVAVAVGRFGPYVKYEGSFYSLPKTTNIHQMSLEDAIKGLQSNASKSVIKAFEEDALIKVLDGRFGPYIVNGKTNYKIPKDMVAEELTYQQCLEIISSDSNKTKRKKYFGKKR